MGCLFLLDLREINMDSVLVGLEETSKVAAHCVILPRSAVGTCRVIYYNNKSFVIYKETPTAYHPMPAFRVTRAPSHRLLADDDMY